MVYEASLLFSGFKPGENEIICHILQQSGVSPYERSETVERGRTRISLFFQRKIQADLFGKKIRLLRLRGVKVSRRKLYQRDWLTKWKKYFLPFNLTRRLRIVPYGCQDKALLGSKEPVLIDTAVAFGTGMHPTTQMTAQFIEDKRGFLGRFLDVGTGSGILSIVAAKSGADKITAIDLDPAAITTARRNFALNRLRGTKLCRLGIADFCPEEKFQFVAANLLTDELLAARRPIISCVNPGGYLAVSGISVENLPRFRESFEKRRLLKCLRIRKIKGWAALLYRRY